MYDLQAATNALIRFVQEMRDCPLNKHGRRDGNKEHGISKRCLNALEKAGCGRNEANEMMRDALK